MAQLTPQELQELVKLYERVNGLTRAAARAQAQQAESMGVARDELERLGDVWNDFVNDLSNAERQFARITDQIKGQRSGINQAASSYDKLRSISAKISDIQDRTVKTSLKELNSLREKAESERKRLETAKILLEDQKRAAQFGSKEYYKTELALSRVNKTLSDQEGHFEAINQAVDREEKKLKDIQDTLGISGALLKGISKIPFIGNLPGMSEVLGEIEDEIIRIREEEGRLVSKSEALGMVFKKMGSIITKNLNDPLVIGTFVIKQIVDAFKSIDAGSGKLAKDMNMSYSEAVNFRGELSKIATLSADNAINTKGLQESYTAIGQSLGANADINEKDLIVFTKLREQAGYTNNELVSIQKLSLLTGKNVEDTAKEFFGSAKALSAQKGLAINVKQLLKETANTSNAIKLSLLGAKGGLAEAAVKAKEFGINLEQADKIAGSLLNFEDSISAELEAELLTGKQLNLETARYAALTGDIGTMAEEINKQIGGSAEFTKMNRIQQEAYARAVGMSREELANSLVEQEGLQRIGVSTAAQAREKYDNLRKTMSAEEARKALGDDELARQYEQQSVQERFTQAVEKLKDIFVTIAEGPIGKIAGFIANILSNSTAMFAVFGGLGGLLISSIIPSMGKMAAVLRLIRMRGIASAIGSIIKGAWEALGGLPVVGPILAGAAIATGIGFLMSKSKETPGLAKGGTVVGAGSVLVGEQGPEVLSMKPGATVTPLSKVNAASEGGKNADISINAGNTVIQLDGVTIAKAITPYVVEEMRKTSVKIQ